MRLIPSKKQQKFLHKTTSPSEWLSEKHKKPTQVTNDDEDAGEKEVSSDVHFFYFYFPQKQLLTFFGYLTLMMNWCQFVHK